MTTIARTQVGGSARCGAVAAVVPSGHSDEEDEMAPQTERFETVIVGAGQAGLATGYHLARQGRSFVILDANERIGDSWRERWDSLRLYSPAKYDGLPGMPFPARRASFPTAREMGDYLEAYAAQFKLPIRTSTAADALRKEGDHYVVTAGAQTFEADNAVVASGVMQKPFVPSFAPELDPQITQLHSNDYRNLPQLKEGGVLVVGASHSGEPISPTRQLSITRPSCRDRTRVRSRHRSRRGEGAPAFASYSSSARTS
jgi:cation diffusion facilitator CzcD-associated flavoprotein CzcO